MELVAKDGAEQTKLRNDIDSGEQLLSDRVWATRPAGLDELVSVQRKEIANNPRRPLSRRRARIYLRPRGQEDTLSGLRAPFDPDEWSGVRGERSVARGVHMLKDFDLPRTARVKSTRRGRGRSADRRDWFEADTGRAFKPDVAKRKRCTLSAVVATNLPVRSGRWARELRVPRRQNQKIRPFTVRHAINARN